MNILFVDDEPTRYSRFRMNLPEAPAGSYVFRYKDRAEQVSIEDFEWADLAMLDHDLCERHYGVLTCPKTGTGHCECETGYDLVKRVIKMDSDKKPKLTVVHSLNPTGSENMIDTLLENGWRVARITALRFSDPVTLAKLLQHVETA